MSEQLLDSRQQFDLYMHDVAARIASLNLPAEEGRQVFETLLFQLYLAQPGNAIPAYSPLKKPIIETIPKATVACCVLPVYKHHDTYWGVVAEAGDHYYLPTQTRDPHNPKYMAIGGYLNLFAPHDGPPSRGKSAEAEDTKRCAIREMNEEMVDDKGKPLFKIHPSRLQEIDSKTVTVRPCEKRPKGETKIIIGYMVELTDREFSKLERHVRRLEKEPGYKEAVSRHTVNPASGRAEVAGIEYHALGYLAHGTPSLLNNDKDAARLFTAAEKTLRTPQRWHS